MTRPTARQSANRLLIAGLVAAVAALLFFSWLAEEVAEGDTATFDATVRGFVHAHSSPALTSVMRFMSTVGEPLWLLILGAAAVFVLVGEHWPRAVRLFLITQGGAMVLDLTLKLVFHRVRPQPFFGTPVPHSYSFPSGHALFSVCFWGVLAALATARIRNHIARVGIWTSAALIAASIGYSRIYLGVHYPSDVVAGYAAAVVWVTAVASADHILQRRRERGLAAEETNDDNPAEHPVR